uniref:Uncharacterized protein n=1 Tax=viral metagenome TaxID=1070528 RepID=A0A6C0CJ21_9ZZZZ
MSLLDYQKLFYSGIGAYLIIVAVVLYKHIFLNFPQYLTTIRYISGLMFIAGWGLIATSLAFTPSPKYNRHKSIPYITVVSTLMIIVGAAWARMSFDMGQPSPIIANVLFMGGWLGIVASIIVNRGNDHVWWLSILSVVILIGGAMMSAKAELRGGMGVYGPMLFVLGWLGVVLSISFDDKNFMLDF